MNITQIDCWRKAEGFKGEIPKLGIIKICVEEKRDYHDPVVSIEIPELSENDDEKYIYCNLRQLRWAVESLFQSPFKE